MRTVKITKEEFLQKLRENREQHRAIFEKAQEGYCAFLIKELEQRLEEVRRGLKVDRHIRLDEPMDHTSDYDQMISMAEMHQDSTIELTASEFACYVMDRWAWKQEWVGSVNAYGVDAS